MHDRKLIARICPAGDPSRLARGGSLKCHFMQNVTFMHNTIAPCLRPEVAVRPFDAAEGDCRFVVAVDDRHFLVSAAVAAVLEESRESRTLTTLAQRASARLGLSVSAQQVERLLREQAPEILFEPNPNAGGPVAPVRFRRLIASGHTLRPLLQVVARLFSTRWAVLLAALFIVVESLVASRALAAPPETLAGAETAAAMALTMLGVLIHEIGHLSACVRHQVPHGGVGVGLYWCMPVFFAEVHGAWMLARQQRAVVDAGGLYLQSAYVLLLGSIYLATGTPAVLAAIACSHFLMLHTLNPVMKYDGYWLLSDLTGTHNLHRHVRRLAEGAWRAVCLGHTELMPSARDLALLGAFLAAAGAYFAYTFFVLAQGLARTAARVVEHWTANAAGTQTSVASFQAVGEAVWLALLVVMAGGIAFLLARSLGAFARESSNVR